MSSICRWPNVEEKVAISREYAEALAGEYAEIEAIIMFGSTVRGDCLPTSDIDMLYLVSKGAKSLPIDRFVHYRGLVIDIEAVHREDLTADKVLEDGYLFGLYNDAVVLYDKTGFMRSLKDGIERNESDAHYTSRVEKLKEPVYRNMKRFRDALPATDYAEICLSAGFFVWCLADLLLTGYRMPVGGFRTLARIKMRNTDAFLVLLALQDSIRRTRDELESFGQIAQATMAVEKTQWMFENGFKDEAFHCLWIQFGLQIKDAKLHPSEAGSAQIGQRSRSWLEKLHWTPDVLSAKAEEMQAAISAYVVEGTRP